MPFLSRPSATVHINTASEPRFGEAWHGKAFAHDRWPDTVEYLGKTLASRALVIKTLAEHLLASRQPGQSVTVRDLLKHNNRFKTNNKLFESTSMQNVSTAVTHMWANTRP